MSYSDCLIFDLQWTPGLGKIEVSSGFLKTEWIQTGPKKYSHARLGPYLGGSNEPILNALRIKAIFANAPFCLRRGMDRILVASAKHPPHSKAPHKRRLPLRAAFLCLHGTPPRCRPAC
jgi:hypothetical protein